MKKKLFSIRQTRFYAAIALLIQSFTFFILFLILCAKKKSISAAFLAVSAMEGGAAAYLLYQLKEEADAIDAAQAALCEAELDEAAIAADLAYGADEAEAPVRRQIPREEHVSEEEFQ